MTDKPTRLQKYSAPALEKGLDILELLSLKDGSGLSHSEIASGIGRSKNEIFRMMVVLEERGYIERGDEDVFRLSSKMGNLSANASDEAKLREITRPFLARLCEETGRSNHLWVISDGEMRVALTCEAGGAYSLSRSEGDKGRLFQSSAGACFLSGLSQQEDQIALLADLGEFIKPESYQESFAEQVEDCVQTGISIMASRQARSVLEVSAPLRIGERANVIGAVTVPMLGASRQDNEVSAVIDALKQTIGALNMRLKMLAPLQV